MDPEGLDLGRVPRAVAREKEACERTRRNHACGANGIRNQTDGRNRRPKRGNNGHLYIHLGSGEREIAHSRRAQRAVGGPTCRGHRALLRTGGSPTSDISGLARGGSGPIVCPVSVGPSGKTRTGGTRAADRRTRERRGFSSSRRNHGLETPSRGQPGRDRAVIVDGSQRAAQRSAG